MTQEEINQAEWADPGNWRGGWLGIYRSERDTRIMVPKRNPVMGWTINTAHPVGRVMLVAAPVVAVVAVLLAILRGGRPG